MSLEQDLFQRSSSQCELCTSSEDLQVFEVADSPKDAENHILICANCKEQFEDPEKINTNHWRCLNDSMWSPVPAVQVIAWRMLNQLKAEGWPQDLLDMMYMEDNVKTWATANQVADPSAKTVVHRDSNGVILEAGDTIVLIKDLKVKGSSIVAKQGTAVRRISLDHENEEYIEGKVDGQQIVIITKYVKKI